MVADSNLSIRARVQVTVEIDPGDTWSSDVRADQVFKQGSEKAVALVSKALAETHGVVSVEAVTVRCVIATERAPNANR